MNKTELNQILKEFTESEEIKETIQVDYLLKPNDDILIAYLNIQDYNLKHEVPFNETNYIEYLEEYLEDELLPEEFEYVHLDVNANLQPIIILVK